ncbi:retrovirus-related pol polyprotein from transposon TNT 1-94 [Tanacetum coccineum]
MIKDINKLLKERKMMRSFETFIGVPPVSIEGVEERRIGNLRDKGVEKKEPLQTLRAAIRFNTTAGNPVKKILLKLNLSDHRSILTDSKEYLKMVMEALIKKVQIIVRSTAFLHSDLDEDIYMTQLEGFQSVEKEETYFMHRARYKRCAMDHCFYLKNIGLSSIILLLYVDDILVVGSDMEKIKKLKRQLSQEFKMKDLGSTKQILGMSIVIIK